MSEWIALVVTKHLRVIFVNEQLNESYNALKNGTFEERMLARRIEKVLDQLALNPKAGIHIPLENWPKEYKQKYQLTNLWKRNLGGDWRLIYTIDTNRIEVVTIILEWMDHKSYNRLFNYQN